MTASEKAPDVEFSLTVSRALTVLSMFSRKRPTLALSEISKETKLSKASVLRFMQALILHGYVEQDAVTRKYRPGFEAFRIGSLVGGLGLRTIALPIMRFLTSETGFTSYLSVMFRDHMMPIASVEGNGPLRLNIPIGEQIPLHSTSTGQAALSVLDDAEVCRLLRDCTFVTNSPRAPASLPQLLKRLAEVRSQGYALSWEMSSPGVGSVSSPAVGPDGRVAAVMTLGFGIGQVEKAACGALGLKVNRAAKQLTELLQSSADMLAA